MDLGAFTSGALIGLREGVEAALIVAIVLAYLVRSGNRGHIGKVWVGTAAAAALSALIGVLIFVSVGAFREPYEQLFEGTTMLVAAGVVTWMLFWMRRQSAGLKGELHAAIERALGDGRAWGLAVLVFSAVIREGVETALFLAGQATSVSASASSVGAGALAGLSGAAVLGWGFYRGSRRVDLRRFFRWTGIALVFIAAGLLSKAVHEYIEVAGIAGLSLVGAQPAFDLSRVLSSDVGIGEFLHAIFGYSASPELLTLVAHVGYVVGVLWLYLRPLRVTGQAPGRTPASA